jgi:arylsulfatase A-like enzyme
VLAGVQHIAASTAGKQAWQIIGYDKCLEGEQHEQAASFLQRSPKEPFFLSVGFFETHRKFPAIDDSPENPKYCLPPSPLPDTPETRKDMAGYKTSARELDRKMGIVLDSLDRSGLAANTIVICTTDHGVAFPRMKCNLHDSGIGTMLIMRGPGGFTGGEVIDSMTSHLDIFPTICELLEIDQPPWLRGKSLVPLVRKAVGALHEELFFEINYHAAYEPMRAIRTNRWKYIRRFDGRATSVLPNCDDGESKSFWLDHGWKKKPVPEESLFNLVFDPNETDNLVDDTGHEAILSRMRDRLKRWMEETYDPLLSGDLRPPTGAVINDRNGLSPGEKPQAAQQGAEGGAVNRAP